MKLPEKRMHCPCDHVTGQRLWDFLKANDAPLAVAEYAPYGLAIVYYKIYDTWVFDNDCIGFSIKYPQYNVTPSEFCAAFGLAWPENTNQ